MAKSDRELMEEILRKTTETNEETKKITENYQKVDSARPLELTKNLKANSISCCADVKNNHLSLSKFSTLPDYLRISLTDHNCSQGRFLIRTAILISLVTVE